MAIFGKKEPNGPLGPGEVLRREPAGVVPGTPVATARRDLVAAATTTVGPTIRVKGEMAGDEDVNVEGRIEGIVSLTRSLTVGKAGVVEADIRAQTVVVHGRVVGNVVAEQRVEIFPTGRLEGNIKSPKISIHEGAHFKGNVDMSAPAPVRADGTAKVQPGERKA